jgi:hypothetical protein
MTAFLIANIAPLMFGTLVVVLLLGYPVAFSLAAVGIGLRSSASISACTRPPAGAAGTRLGRNVQRHAAVRAVLRSWG